MLGQQPLPNLGNRCLSIGQPLPNNWATFAQPWASVAQYLSNGCPMPGLDNGCEYLGNGCPTLGQRLLTYWANFVHARTVDKILGTMCQNKTGHGPHLDSFHSISLPTCASCPCRRRGWPWGCPCRCRCRRGYPCHCRR